MSVCLGTNLYVKVNQKLVGNIHQHVTNNFSRTNQLIDKRFYNEGNSYSTHIYEYLVTL